MVKKKKKVLSVVEDTDRNSLRWRLLVLIFGATLVCVLLSRFVSFDLENHGHKELKMAKERFGTSVEGAQEKNNVDAASPPKPVEKPARNINPTHTGSTREEIHAEHCAEWSCSCQGASNAFDLFHMHWGKTPRDHPVRRWWAIHECRTKPGDVIPKTEHAEHLDDIHYFMMKNTSKTGKYLWFDWNGGRVNNNIIAMSAALSLAKMYDRTLILHSPDILTDSDFPSGIHSFIGIFEGFFDLSYIKELGYDIILEHNISPRIRELKQEAKHDGETDAKKCSMNESGGKYDLKGGNIPKAEKYDSCEVVYFRDPFSYMNHEMQMAREFLRPSKWIRDAAEKYLLAQFPAGDNNAHEAGIPKVSVHQRHHAWGDKKAHGSKYLCRGVLKNIWSTEPGFPYRSAVKMWTDDEAKQKALLNVTSISCGLTYEEMVAILEYFQVDVPSKFFLATDREEPDSFDKMVSKGALVFSEHPPEVEAMLHHVLDHPYEINHNCKIVYCPDLAKLRDLVYILMDMWATVKSEFFVGGYYSTMSETICYWRGQAQQNNSNICFLPERLKHGWVKAPGDP